MERNLVLLRTIFRFQICATAFLNFRVLLLLVVAVSFGGMETFMLNLFSKETLSKSIPTRGTMVSGLLQKTNPPHFLKLKGFDVTLKNMENQAEDYWEIRHNFLEKFESIG